MAARRPWSSNWHVSLHQPSGHLRRALAVTMVLGAITANGSLATSTDSGRELFERGSAGGKALSARAGADGSWVLHGAAVACANCHGLTGTGGGEGYLRAPDLRWSQWSSPDPRQHDAARIRLRRALQQGIGADGRVLGTAMPRFDLDEAGFDALAGHLQTLASEHKPGARPHLAVLQLNDGQQGATELELGLALRACLRQRLGERAEVEFVTVASQAEAQAQWYQWQQRSEVLAVLAPPWRGWRPPTPAEGKAALTALFPLVADPDVGRSRSVQWLFGGVEARAVALIQAWLQRAPAQSATLPVWLGPDAPATAAREMLERMAQVVLRDTGRPLAWRVLDLPRLPSGEAGLWLDTQRMPTEGWWLVPYGAAARPDPRTRWWMAAPFAGQPPRSLAQRWADATCRTAEAALDEPLPTGRDRWLQAVASTARLRDGNGWEWHVPAQDAYGYGASTAWTVVEMAAGAQPTPVAPQVNIGRPVEAARRTAPRGKLDTSNAVRRCYADHDRVRTCRVFPAA